jgi:hypothetical protein
VASSYGNATLKLELALPMTSDFEKEPLHRKNCSCQKNSSCKKIAATQKIAVDKKKTAIFFSKKKTAGGNL